MTPPPRQWLRRTKTPRAVRGRADPPTANQRVAAPGVVLLTLLVAVFMGQFDFFVVNVAAPSLRHDLHSSDSGLELIVGGYAFSYAGALVLGGRLGDIFGHRRLFIVGMVGFAITSAVCGLSTASGQLVGGRLGQGLTAALMLPQVLALISASPDACRRSQAMAWYGVAGGVGAIAGQVLGGLLITANIAGLGWRTIFWVNVPVGALGALAAVRVLPSAGRTARSSFNSLDPLGALGFAAGLALMLIPLTVGRSTGWPWWTWVSIAAASTLVDNSFAVPAVQGCGPLGAGIIDGFVNFSAGLPSAAGHNAAILADTDSWALSATPTDTLSAIDHLRQGFTDSAGQTPLPLPTESPASR